MARAIDRCRTILERVSSDRKAAASVARALAQLEGMRGEFEEARRLYRSARATLEDLGWHHDAALVSFDSAPIELMAGEPEAAVAELTGGIEALRSMGDVFFLPTMEAYLAEALLRTGDEAGAAAAAERSRQTADEEDLAPQVLWRAAQSRILASEGEPESAIAMAREAVELSQASDGPMLQGDAWLGLALTGVRAGDREVVDEALTRALDLYEAKGAVAAAERARALVEGA